MPWKAPGYVRPVPSLRFLFHFEGEMGTFRQPHPDTHVEKATVMFKGGQLQGPKLRGEILSGDGSMHSRQHIFSRALRSDMYAAWEVANAPVSNYQNKYIPCRKIRYHLQTDNKAIIYLNSIGAVTEQREILGGQIKRDDTPASYERRLRFTVKTDYPAYSWINDAVIVECAVKIEDMLLYGAYKLD
jgi:Protein of unknown function (DUF3237)